MADADYAFRAVKAYLDNFVPAVEQIAADSADTEAVLYRKGLADDERSLMRFEYELRREVECWKAIRAKIDERIAEREALADEQIRRRVEGRDT